eukprot:COSAG06_NODE_1246_length_10113_cov_21.479629_11_plen_703_part_00
MQIVVSILTGPARGRQVSPDVEGEHLVEALRLKIQTLVAERLDEDGSSAAPELQRLMFGETVLEDGNTLAQYEIRKEAELTLHLRMRLKPIRFDAGCSCFSADLDTLEAVQGSRLAAMFAPVRQGGVAIEVRAAPAAAGGTSSDESSSDESSSSEDCTPEGVPYEEAKPLQKAADGAYLLERGGLTFPYMVRYLESRRPVYRNGCAEPPAPEVEILLPDAVMERQLLAEDAAHYGLTEVVAACHAAAGSELLAELERRGYAPADQMKLVEDGLTSVEELDVLQDVDLRYAGIDTAKAAMRVAAREAVAEEDTVALRQFLEDQGAALSDSATAKVMGYACTIERLSQLAHHDWSAPRGPHGPKQFAITCDESVADLKLNIVDRRELRNVVERAKLVHAGRDATEEDRKVLRRAMERNGGELTEPARVMVLKCCPGFAEVGSLANRAAQARLEAMHMGEEEIRGVRKLFTSMTCLANCQIHGVSEATKQFWVGQGLLVASPQPFRPLAFTLRGDAVELAQGGATARSRYDLQGGRAAVCGDAPMVAGRHFVELSTHSMYGIKVGVVGEGFDPARQHVRVHPREPEPVPRRFRLGGRQEGVEAVEEVVFESVADHAHAWVYTPGAQAAGETDWVHRGEKWKGWSGRSCIGLLVDLDVGNLQVFADGHMLGIVAEGIVPPVRWACECPTENDGASLGVRLEASQMP